MREIGPGAIIAALTGEASPEEVQRLVRWRAASDENEAAYQRVLRMWTATGEFAPSPVASAPPPVQRVIRLAENGWRANARGPGATRGRFGLGESIRRLVAALTGDFPWPLAGAATLGVGILLGFWFSRGPEARPFGADTFVTGVDETSTVMLQDETIVRLAPSSRLTILDPGNTREVTLVGRAFFAVARDTERPFRVRLSSGDVVEVLGTRFDVLSRDQAVQVAVAEGEVRVGSLRTRVTLRANEVARILADEVPRVERVDDVYTVIDWLGPFLAFESTPLRDVAHELRLRFGTPVEIVEPELADRTVTGWFSDQTPTEIIGGICRVVGASCTVEDGVHRMSLQAR